MDIQGLDYNTQREKLALPEYGREIQKMVDYAITLPTREERTRCAQAIVKKMEMLVPSVRVNTDYKHMLWDHLYLMGHQQLDIDWPYDMSEADNMNAKPQPMPLPQGNFRLRHYGRLVDEMLKKIMEMPEGQERDELVRMTANQMKRDLVQWGQGSNDDEKVIDDIARLTNGIIQIDPQNFRFERITNVPIQQQGKKSKKRK
jgi:hypothetical protein